MMDELKSMCEERVIRHVDAENAEDLLQIAQDCEAFKLKSMCQLLLKDQ